jgi:hypothetical protein
VNLSRIEANLAKINPSPVIILGNQKSGTSVIAHLIADYGGLTKIIDIPEIWWPALEDLMLRRKSLEEFANKNILYFAKQLIKEPNLTFLYPQLRTLFPKAAYVFVVRDPRTNIRSLLNRIGLPGNLAALEPEKSDIPEKWVSIFDAQMWGLTTVHYVDMLSERWNRAVDVYLENKTTMEMIRYEDFVRNKVEMIKHIAKLLGLQQKEDISNRVDVQYQPKGDRNISWLDFFGTVNLSRIEAICGTRMQEFGYKIS